MMPHSGRLCSAARGARARVRAAAITTADTQRMLPAHPNPVWPARHATGARGSIHRGTAAHGSSARLMGRGGQAAFYSSPRESERGTERTRPHEGEAVHVKEHAADLARAAEQSVSRAGLGVPAARAPPSCGALTARWGESVVRGGAYWQGARARGSACRTSAHMHRLGHRRARQVPHTCIHAVKSRSGFSSVLAHHTRQGSGGGGGRAPRRPQC